MIEGMKREFRRFCESNREFGREFTIETLPFSWHSNVKFFTPTVIVREIEIISSESTPPRTPGVAPITDVLA
jgi:hypothetical protein